MSEGDRQHPMLLQYLLEEGAAEADSKERIRKETEKKVSHVIVIVM